MARARHREDVFRAALSLNEQKQQKQQWELFLRGLRFSFDVEVCPNSGILLILWPNGGAETRGKPQAFPRRFSSDLLACLIQASMLFRFGGMEKRSKCQHPKVNYKQERRGRLNIEVQETERERDYWNWKKESRYGNIDIDEEKPPPLEARETRQGNDRRYEENDNQCLRPYLFVVQYAQKKSDFRQSRNENHAPNCP